MIKTLKVLMIIYGVVLIVGGLGNIFMPEQTAEMFFGVTNINNFAKFGGAGLGAIYLAAGVWLLFTAADPLRNINWVRFVITKAVLSIAVLVYANGAGWIDLQVAGVSMGIADAIMVVLFLVAYPWRRAQSIEHSPS